ncbi:MAG: GNAT family N-acetyltransferase [Pseudonocardiales bacterium]
MRKYAGQNRRGHTAATWVIADAQYRVVAYATLSMTGIDRSSAPVPLAKGTPAVIPALLIGRLAVDQSATHLGLGTQLVKHVLATSVELNLKAACRAVVINALNERAYTWWQRFGFVPFDPDDAGSLDLYLLSSDIQATLS